VYKFHHAFRGEVTCFKQFEKAGTLFIDEKFFTRRKAFQKKCQFFSQDMYYILSEYYSDTHLAKQIMKNDESCDLTRHSIVVYFSSYLFRLQTESVLDYKPSRTDVAVFKYFWKTYLAFKRKYKNFDIQDILDRRATA
jgi:hypothetical protein